MPYFFYYLLKVILCSAVLFGYYHLFLRNKVYHAYNRFYLLAAMAISLVAPLLNFNVLFNTGDAVTRPVQLLQAVNSSDAYMEGIVIYTQQNYLTTSQVLMLLYATVSVIMLILLVKVFIQIFNILRTNSSSNLHDVVFVQSDAKGTPFSFFKFIFWNRAIDINTPTGRRIFAHELAHVREKHSADKLFVNLLLIFFWINPIFWLIKRELNLIHEFIADKKAIADNDAGALAAMIVQSAYPQHSYLLTSHFFYSPIKRRLKMLTKYNNKKAGYLYRILALPVVLFLVAALTIKAKSGIGDILNPGEKITVVIDAGHGGQDGGSLSTDGKTTEKDINLALVKKIRELNNLSNIELVFTREADVYQQPQEKLSIANNAGADLFISVHVAGGPVTATDKSGAEVYVSGNNFSNSNASKVFASVVINHFKDNYTLGVCPNPVQRAAGIKVLQGTQCPAVIIEAGYMNNSRDMAFLQSEKGQEAFAKNILAAISQYAAARKNNDVIEVPAAIQDTVPSYGTLKGEKVTQVTVMAKVTSPNQKVITVQVASGKRYQLTEEEAEKAGIELPPPPPFPPPPPPPAPGVPPPPPPPPPMPSVDDWVAVDASQRVNVKLNRSSSVDSLIVIRGKSALAINPEPVWVLNGNIVAKEEVKAISPNSISTINILRDDNARKYGAIAAVNGVIEVSTRPATLQAVEAKNVAAADLKEVVVEGFRSNTFFVGVNNTISIPNAPAGLRVSVANGRVSEQNGQWIVQVAAPCETTVWLTSAEGKTLGSYAFNARYLPDNFKGSLNHTLYIQDDNKIFTKVEQEAEFPGGVKAWGDFLKSRLDNKMPKEDGWKNGAYSLILKFIVRTDGTVTDVVAENYAGSKTAQMCINLMKSSPKWKPAKQNGLNVAAYRRQPITFVVN